MSDMLAEDRVTASGDGEKYSVRNASGELLPPGTYFVVRATDVFAASGLWAYIHNMETVLELDAQAGFLRDDQARHLRELADRATQLARSWQESGLGSIPD